MSRPLRIEYPGAWYYVINRGGRSEDIFRDKKDYDRFVELVKESSDMWNVRIAAYCLMPKPISSVCSNP
jgi:REP element-mobilizing transposase RayT